MARVPRPQTPHRDPTRRRHPPVRTRGPEPPQGSAALEAGINPGRGWRTSRQGEYGSSSMRPRPRPRPRALVADADADNRHLLMLVAEQAGFRAWGTATRADTTTMLSETRFDVVVLDSWLAPAHTTHILAGFKARRQRLPVLAVSTGGAKPHDAGSLLAAGADTYIDKPFSLATVRRELQHLRDHWTPSTRGVAKHTTGCTPGTKAANPDVPATVRCAGSLAAARPARAAPQPAWRGSASGSLGRQDPCSREEGWRSRWCSQECRDVPRRSGTPASTRWLHRSCSHPVSLKSMLRT